MKKINLKSVTNSLSKKEMMNVTGSRKGGGEWWGGETGCGECHDGCVYFECCPDGFWISGYECNCGEAMIKHCGYNFGFFCTQV